MAGVRPAAEANVCGLAFEQRAREQGARLIAGVDEVGRGALAGPVVAAAVILDLTRVPVGIDDSKKLSRATREKLAEEIRACAVACSVARVEADEIDRINILGATREAMCRAISSLKPEPDHLLIDAVPLRDLPLPQQAIIRCDSISASIAAASIIAKVARDEWMREYDREFPAYGFARHVGYATAEHIRSLREHGPSPIHRLTFRKVLPEPEQQQLFRAQKT
jgi:ribonuclease HII